MEPSLCKESVVVDKEDDSTGDIKILLFLFPFSNCLSEHNE